MAKGIKVAKIPAVTVTIEEPAITIGAEYEVGNIFEKAGIDISSCSLRVSGVAVDADTVVELVDGQMFVASKKIKGNL